jgi:hypothetical protein
MLLFGNDAGLYNKIWNNIKIENIEEYKIFTHDSLC